MELYKSEQIGLIGIAIERGRIFSRLIVWVVGEDHRVSEKVSLHAIVDQAYRIEVENLKKNERKLTDIINKNK